VLVADGDVDESARTIAKCRTLAEMTGSDLLIARVEMAEARLLRAMGNPAALELLQRSLNRLRLADQSLAAGRARLEMAQELEGTDPAGAVAWARGALATFSRLGASRDEDATLALLRRLGHGGRPGPRRDGVLTDREYEVLRLIAEGLSNREIAEALVISPKTAEHHVGQVLAKVGAKRRSEAAALLAAGSIAPPGKR
jgi:DNA-binding CsgD family transcriptional regulator